MRSSDCDILMVPGYLGAGPHHWQTRWQERLSTARRIDQASWDRPDFDDWQARIIATVDGLSRPGVIVAHSLGVIAVVHAAPRLGNPLLRGAFMVAPLGEGFMAEHEDIDVRFAHVPRAPLPFPSVLAASRNDPFCPYLVAEEWAHAWGSDFSDAGDSGHIDTDSGHGPWPEGLMRFAGFLRKL